MRRFASKVLALLAGVLGGCSVVVGGFDECSADADCAARGQGLVCVERLCVVPAVPGPECAVDADCAAKGADHFCEAERCVTDPMVARCGRTLGAEPAESNVFVGALLPFTSGDGKVDARGEARAAAIGLAIDEINEREGVNGRRKLTVVVCDTASDPELARAQASYLARRYEAPALITGGSRETLAVAAEAIPRGILVLSATATSAELTELNDKQSPTDAAGLVWRTAPSDAIQGKVIADVMLAGARKGTKVAVLAINDPYAQGLAAVFKARFGTAHPSSTFNFERTTDGAQALTQAEAYEPTEVLFIGFPTEAVPMLNKVAASHPKLKAARWFFTDSTRSASMFAQLADASFLEGARGTAPATVKGEAYTGFAERYRAKVGSDPAGSSFTAHNYDAAYLVALAASWAAGSGEGAITGVRMAEGLTKVSGDLEFVLGPTTYTSARAQLEQGKEIDVVGASGALNFDPRTGEAPANIEEWKYTAAGGITQVEVHTLDLAERRCRRTAGAPKSATTITVGVLLSFTTPDGGEDPWGDAQTNAIALAADEINSREGVNGRRKFHLVVCDTVDIAENAREQAAHLIRDHGAQALITGGSRETLAVAAEAVPKGVLVMSSSATSPELTELSDKQSPTDAAGLVWRTSPSDAIQGRVLADIVRADPTPNPRVAVLAVDEPYGQGLAQVFRSRYGTSNSRAFLFESGSNGADALTQAEAYAPTHVLLIGFPGELVPILKDVSANRPALKGAKWYFSDSAKALEVFNQVPDRAFLENAHGTAPASSDGPAFESFRSRYQSKFKADPTQVSFTANSYDAFYLVALAASYASTATGDKPITGVRMAEGLTKVSSGTPRLLEPLSYAGARGDMENGRSIDVEGASGKLDFDASTGEAPSMIEEWKYAGGAFSTVQLHDP